MYGSILSQVLYYYIVYD